MYLPSMLFGGSSLLHLLAGHPRVVAVFGLGALMTTLLQSPFGQPNLPGTAGYVKYLDQVARIEETVDPAVIERARAAARALAQASPNRIAEIVEGTLQTCGSGCVGVNTAAVLKNPSLLGDVLFVHALNEAKTRRSEITPTFAAKATAEPR